MVKKPRITAKNCQELQIFAHSLDQDGKAGVEEAYVNSEQEGRKPIGDSQSGASTKLDAALRLSFMEGNDRGNTGAAR